jgi:pimeloyl-ACP methyl ester carboxylesterase
MTNQNTTHSTDTHILSDGRSLAYTSSGDPDGFPVLAHHGTLGSRLFAALFSDVAADEGVRLIVPDRPGYGRSATPPSGWTWEDWQNDLAELLNSESIDQASVMGFSGGGPFAVAAANCEWARRLGVVSTVIPPSDAGIVRLAKIPFAVRVLFRLSNIFASVAGPEAVVKQYTDRSVPEAVSQAIGNDFHEALSQGAKAIQRENRLFATNSLSWRQLSIPIQAWHGTKDKNTPLSPVEAFVENTGGTLITSQTDHLGTLLDSKRDVLNWLSCD